MLFGVYFAVSVVSAFCAYAFGAQRGAGIALVLLIVTAVVLALAVPASFQGYLMLVSFGAPLSVLAIGLGLGAGELLRRKSHWVAVLLLLPSPYLMWSTHSNESSAAEESALAMEFVSSNKQVADLAGGPFKVYPSSSTTYRGDRGPGRYELAIDGAKHFNVFLAVSRDAERPKFSVLCTTTLSMGLREAGKDACLQSPLALPK